MSEVVLIEDWKFDARSGELMRGDVTKRLEDRSARTLALLCEKPGEVVSRQLIIDSIWNGRHVSENSLAVVIADIRRAFGDDARNARFIETVAKRGYRVIAPVSEPALPSRDVVPGEHPQASGAPGSAPAERTSPGPRRLQAVGGIAAIILCVLAAMSIRSAAEADGRRVVMIGQVANDTGKPELAPLASALHELMLDQVASLHGVRVVDGRGAAPLGSSLRLNARLIMWNATPTLSLAASDASHDVLWSEMAVGTPGTIAGVTVRKLAVFGRQLASCDGRDTAGVSPLCRRPPSPG